MSALETLRGRFIDAHRQNSPARRVILSFGAYPAAGKETTLLALAKKDTRFANAEPIHKTFNSLGLWPARYADHIRHLAEEVKARGYQDKAILVKNATPLSFFLRLIAESELSKTPIVRPLNKVHFSDRSIAAIRDIVVANSEYSVGDTIYRHSDDAHYIYPSQIIRPTYQTGFNFVDNFQPHIGDAALLDLMFTANYRLPSEESLALDGFLEQAAAYILSLGLQFIPFKVYFLNRPTILSNWFYTAGDQTHANPNRNMWMQVLSGQRKMWLKLAEVLPEIVFPIDCDETPGIAYSAEMVAQLTYARMLANDDL